MSYEQTKIILQPRNRGFHLITDEVVQALPQLRDYPVAILHLFIQHTSASLTINENADPTVRADFSSCFDRLAPENAPYYRHTLEGSDDMPAHLKSSLLGASLSIPVSNGKLALGTWQGIYLGEHRDFGGQRTLVATLMGESR